MVGAELLRDQPRVARLIELSRSETDRERVQRSAESLGCKGDHCARIETAREEGSKRHLAFETHADRLAQQAQDLFSQVAVGTDKVAAVSEIPVSLHLDAASLPREPVGRREALDSLERGQRRRDVMKAEKELKSLVVRLAWNVRVLKDCLDLGPEHQTARDLAVVERFLAQPVASQKQGLLRHVPDRHRKHSAQLVQARWALVLPPMDHHLAGGWCPRELV